METPQTAAQINAPQVGALELPATASPATPTPPVNASAQPGWWSLSLAGTREGVLKAIAADQGVPAHWKAALRAEIEAQDSKFNFFRLDAHYHTPSNLHLTIKGSTALV